MIFDILKNEFVYSISNNPNMKSQEHLYEDDNQFNVFALCRTSDVYEEKVKAKKGEEVQLQRIKY